MERKLYKFTISIFFILISLPGTSFGISVEQLREIKENQEKVTIIDIRNSHVYRECHIPGAINIPASLIGRKSLPAIGRVVVCGDGIDNEVTLKAVVSLNSKSGIEAERLDGGMQAWETFNFPDTRSGGFKRQMIHYLSYQQLEKVVKKNQDLIILDMRKKADNESELSNLNAKFPGVRTLKLGRNKKSRDKGEKISLAGIGGGKSVHHNRYYVLIDDGSGEAEGVAYRLKAAGIKRMSILAGGEIILSADGKSGVGKK